MANGAVLGLPPGRCARPLGGFSVLRILLSVGNIVFSLILGALLMAVVAIYSPETLSMMLGWARTFKGADHLAPASIRNTTFGSSCCSRSGSFC